MICRILWTKMRRRKLFLGFVFCLALGGWFLVDYQLWLNKTCTSPYCKKLKAHQRHEYEELENYSPQRMDDVLMIPNPIKGLQHISNASVCTLPNVDPFDTSVSHLITDFGTDPQCIGPPVHFTVNSKSNLALKNKEYRRSVDMKSVSLQYISRPSKDDSTYDISDEIMPFQKNGKKNSKRKISQDFLRLEYKVRKQEESKVQFIAKVSAQLHLLKKLKTLESQNPAGMPLNILMFGFDSSSRATFQRKLPRTVDYLENKLGAHIFKGYSIVGDGTTPILSALLTGKFVRELQKNAHLKKRDIENLDEWPWIMKEYGKHGYVSLYAEDDQKIATFNIRMKGFTTPPSDHYMRPFWLALEDHALRKLKRKKKFPENNLACLGSEALHNITLDYLFSMHEAYPTTPKFGFAFMSYLSHGIPEKLSYADNDMLGYLARYEKIRNNTVLIILSDHGARIGPLRNSMQGSLEERLPMLAIVLPDWFKESYPELVANMKHNEEVVTSPFDVHATLLHFLSFPNEYPSQKTQSLLTRISKSRTCGEAGIDYHWCPCLNWKPVDVDTPGIHASAQAVVQKLNDVLSKSEYARTKCSPLELTGVVYAAELLSANSGSEYVLSPIKNGRMRRYKIPKGRRYQIVLETSPLKGMFEATVTVRKKGRIVVNPHISRTSVYGDSPHCIIGRHPELRKYCVCYDKLNRLKEELASSNELG